MIDLECPNGLGGCYIKSGSIGINITHSQDLGFAVSLQLIGVGKRHCRVLYIIPVQPELILLISTAKYHYKDAKENWCQLKNKDKLPDRECGMKGLILAISN